VAILARFTRELRESSAVDQRSGVSARFSIAGAETIAAAALRRATVRGESHAVARVVDLEAAVDVLAGKVEFEVGEDGRERQELLDSLPTLVTGLYDDIADRLDATDEAERASAIELALEGLYLARRITKDSDGPETLYG